jgi:hypothetical protein
VTRRSERELREVRAITEVVNGVLENWGIEMDRDGSDDREPSERFAAMIGDDEAVEYEEVYALILDVAKEIFAMTGKVDAPPTTYDYPPLYAGEGLHDNRLLPTTEESWKREHRDYEGGQLYEPADGRPARPIVTMWHDPYETPSEAIARLNTEAVENAREAQRLADIIRRTYGTQGWDIGTVKTMLLPGLDDYHSALLRQQERCGHNDTRVNRAGWVECNDCGRVWAAAPVGIPTGQPYRTDHWGIGFSEGSSRDAWWVEVSLMDENNDEHAVLTLTDKEALELSTHLDERVREGRKDWS